MLIRRVIVSAIAVWGLAFTLTARASQGALSHSGPSPATAALVAVAPAATAQAKPPAAPPGAAAAPAAPAPTSDDCLTCHDDDSLKRGNGTSITVKKDVFTASVHGPMNCVDCHSDLAHAELPHPEKLAKVDCSTCHADQVALYKQSAHAQARARGTDVAATCVDCHGLHDIRPKADPQSRTYHLNIEKTCAKCHGNETVIQKGNIRIGNVEMQFKDSIHGRALNRSGLIVAPTCSDCHGAHDIRQKSDPSSRVAKVNVPSTCGKCHEGIERQFEGSVHGALLAKGSTGGPTCQTCHTAHSIQQADNPNWQLSVISQCGSCHGDKIKTYRDTFHGQITNLGFRAVATCADCHGNHRILPVNNPESPLSAARRVQTCRKCHANASDSFVKYDPHADKDNRERNGVLYFASRFMHVLLIGTFGFFGLHTSMWLTRGMRERRGTRRKGQGGKNASAN
jgi:nitrate/TMAO reductase-like tetraheme cytochrome c subunit